MSVKPVCVFAALVYLASACLGDVVRAEQTGDSMIVNFQGKFILSTPCKINNDRVIDVTFGNVGVDKVNGTDYMQVIPYTVECNGVSDNSSLYLTMNGAATSFDGAAVASSADGLGIQIQANGQPLELNKPLNTTLGALASLKLTAVPVKEPTKILTAQPFTAVATLAVTYQ